jgi:peptide-methionine (R)-S-oxide reductase
MERLKAHDAKPTSPHADLNFGFGLVGAGIGGLLLYSIVDRVVLDRRRRANRHLLVATMHDRHAAEMQTNQQGGRGRAVPMMAAPGIRDSMADKTSYQTQAEELIGLHPVLMFSKSSCPFCKMAKEQFQQMGTRVAVVELDLVDKKLPGFAAGVQDHMQALTGARTVPRVFIGHKFVGGGSDMQELAKGGQLAKLVDAAMDGHKADLSGKTIDSNDIVKSEEEWKKELGAETYRILRQRGTEYPGSHEYDKFHPEAGYFSCAGCGLPLYSSSSKFRSNCGWPVFDKCYHSDDIGCHVATRPDGTGSLEILCPRCSGHLGHVFFDAFSESNPNGERH